MTGDVMISQAIRDLRSVIDRPLNSLPDAGLLVEPVLLHAPEIAFGDDAHDLAVIDDRQMAIAAVLHYAQRLDRGLARRHRIRAMRHDLLERGRGGIPSLRH